MFKTVLVRQQQLRRVRQLYIYILIISARECSLKFDIFNANCNHSPDCEARGSRDQEKAHKVGVFRSSGSISICELLAV